MFRLLLVTFLTLTSLYAANSCVKCHEGIEEIRDPDSKMMQAIYKIAEKAGHKGNDCIVCHGGNPTTMVEERAHRGTVEYFLEHEGPKEYYPAPGSSAINANTCGICHHEQVEAQATSLMTTQQGDIAGALWHFGVNGAKEHGVAAFAAQNPEDPHKRLGTAAYQRYMSELSTLEPQAFVAETTTLAAAPTAEQVEKDPSLAVNTYLRQECLYCHTGSKGRARQGDYRGAGCAACHIPYSNSGIYEGNDGKIAKGPGHLLVHTIQSSREAKVRVHNVEYSGVPVETCSSCHNGGKQIGVSYQGLMETGQAEDGSGLHGKRYLHMQADIHFKKGMLCQDCHTSNDLHGDGFLSGAALGGVEIECQDCHGTTSDYPWELPLGYSDEFNDTVRSGEPRGVATTVAEYLKMGSVSPAPEGFLLTARGNPMTKALRHGDKVTMHLASGRDVELTPLKKLKEEGKLSREALVAMDQIRGHTEALECYSCHSVWAPQAYGGRITVDYSKGNRSIDYLAASHDRDIHGRMGEMRAPEKYLVDGKVTQAGALLRWEEPPLSINGEGRIAPTVPSHQATVTVIGKEGKPLLAEHIFKVPTGDGEGAENAVGMSAIQPHTTSETSRSCESCHTSAKALGLGIGGGRLMADQSRTGIVDLMSAEGRLLPHELQRQIPHIAGPKNGYARFVDENGTRLQSVGQHWRLSAPLSAEQRMATDREGMCLSCHKSMPDGDLAVSAMVHATKMVGYGIDKKEHGSILNKLLLIGAWLQLLVGVVLGGYIIYRLFFKRKNPRRWR